MIENEMMKEKDLNEMKIDSVKRIERCNRIMKDNGDVIEEKEKKIRIGWKNEISEVEKDLKRRVDWRRIGKEIKKGKWWKGF